MTENNEIQFDNSERYHDLGYAISYYRKRKGLTQEQLADQIASADSTRVLSKCPMW